MGCCEKNFLCIIPIIISLIVAVIIGVVFTTTIVTSLATLLYIILGVAAFFLLILVGIILFGKRISQYCVCKEGICLLVGTLGAIVFAGITLSLTVSATALAVLVAIVVFFIVLALIEFFSLIKCLIKAECICKD